MAQKQTYNQVEIPLEDALRSLKSMELPDPKDWIEPWPMTPEERKLWIAVELADRAGDATF